MIALSPEPRPSIWLPPEYRSSFGVDPDTGAAVFGGGTVRNPAGVKITPETALRASVYLACVRVLCETMASLPLYLYRLTPNGKQKAKDHPYYKLFLRRPNGWQTAWEWKQLMMLHLCTYGEAFNEKVLSSSSESLVTELVPLAPSRIKDVVETEAGSLRYTFRADTGKDVPYGQDQVNHVRWLTDDGIRGLVPTELAEDAIALARACEIHGAAFFGNGARPGLVLKTPHETIDPATRDEIRFTWMREHGGPRKAHRPAVLTGGLEPAIVDGNNQESQFLETRRFQAEECCRILGVPPHMVGILDRATFSNIEQQGIGYYQQTVLGWAERIEAALTRDVLGEEMADEYELAFDVSRILRGDAAARMAYYHTGLTDGIFSVNEVREQEGMNSVEGGDQRFVGLNMQTLQQAAAASAASVPPPAETASPAGEPAAEPAANEPAQVADVSLNGAQINGVIAILAQVSTGLLTPDAAKALVEAAFPSVPVPTIDRVLAGTSTKPLTTEPPQETAPAGRSLFGDSRGDLRAFCATGTGGGIDNSCGSGKQAGAWMSKKGYPGAAIKTVAHAKLYGVLVAKAKSEGLGASEAKQTAAAVLKTATVLENDPQFVALCKQYGIDPAESSNKQSPLLLKNDPGIYAAEKAMAAGLIKPPAGLDTSKAGLEVVHPPAEPPKQPVPPKQQEPAKVADAKQPASQPEPTKAGASATPGVPPQGMLPTKSPQGWEENTKAPAISAKQKSAIDALPVAKEAIAAYTGSDYAALNKTLRDNSSNTAGSISELQKFDQKTSLLVASLDVATRMESHDKEFEVYRGAGASVCKQIDMMGVGEVWRDAGFVSTSTRRDMAEGWGGGGASSHGVAMRIRTRYGLNVKSLSNHSSEQEVLLPRRSQFRIVSKEWRYTGSQRRLFVDLEHIGWHP